MQDLMDLAKRLMSVNLKFERHTDTKQKFTLIFHGKLVLDSCDEGDDCLFLENSETPLAKLLLPLVGKCVTARYWLSDKAASIEELSDAITSTLMGNVDSEFKVNYSEITGFLWVDENLDIGGHDLLNELKSNANKYLTLEIDLIDFNSEEIHRLLENFITIETSLCYELYPD